MRASVGAFVLMAATMLGSNACSKETVSAEGTQTGGTESSTTTATESGDSTETSSTQGDTSDTASDSNNSAGSFYAGPSPDFTLVAACDPFAQDCPEGEKCVPYGSGWSDNKCVPVMGDGQAGEPCSSGGSAEGTDDCDEQSFCWNVIDVDGVDVGTCTNFCTGTPEEPSCEVGTSCVITAAVTLCMQSCDPLLQACGDGLACYWTANDFNCIVTAGDIAIGQPCNYINDCIAGSRCVAAETLPSCDGNSCCASFCSLAAPVCPEPGTACASFFEMGQAPPQYADVGICLLP